MQADGRCRSCKAPVRWGVHAVTGRRMPIDPTPTADGNVVIDHYEAGLPVFGVYVNAAAVPAREPLRYRSHFVTCPDAKTWRKGRS